MKSSMMAMLAQFARGRAAGVALLDCSGLFADGGEADCPLRRRFLLAVSLDERGDPDLSPTAQVVMVGAGADSIELTALADAYLTGLGSPPLPPQESKSEAWARTAAQRRTMEIEEKAKRMREEAIAGGWSPVYDGPPPKHSNVIEEQRALWAGKLPKPAWMNDAGPADAPA